MNRAETAIKHGDRKNFLISLSITILLSGGLTTLLADPLTRLDLASTAYFVLSLAGIAVIFLAYLRIGRARRRAQPATPLAPA